MTEYLEMADPKKGAQPMPQKPVENKPAAKPAAGAPAAPAKQPGKK